MALQVIIMAAGFGTRMKSSLPKVMHKICGKPLLHYVIRATKDITRNQPIVVVGHGAQLVEEYLGDSAITVFQPEVFGKRLGTGDAIKHTSGYIKPEDYIFISAGDMPLFDQQIASGLVEHTITNKLDMCIAAINIKLDPNEPVFETLKGFGRIQTDAQGNPVRIIERQDKEKYIDIYDDIAHLNTSIYCFKGEKLLQALELLPLHPDSGEYYLTDCLDIILNKLSGKAGLYNVSEYQKCLGVNNRIDLAKAEQILYRQIRNRHMLNGVTLHDPDTIYIDQDVEIGQDTVIYPNNHIYACTRIGNECVLYPGNRLENATIKDNVTLISSTVISSQVGSNTSVGPNAYIRPNSIIGDNCKIGDFVEIKASIIGDRTKVPHLAYVGDAEIGSACNIGCGAIFANYDGKNKHKTIVEDQVFVGSNCNLVAPVHIYKGAFLAAGSTIIKDVPENSLAIARARQENKDNWVLKKKDK